MSVEAALAEKELEKAGWDEEEEEEEEEEAAAGGGGCLVVVEGPSVSDEATVACVPAGNAALVGPVLTAAVAIFAAKRCFLRVSASASRESMLLPKSWKGTVESLWPLGPPQVLPLRPALLFGLLGFASSTPAVGPLAARSLWALLRAIERPWCRKTRRPPEMAALSCGWPNSG
jgi:hypothetical protein